MPEAQLPSTQDAALEQFGSLNQRFKPLMVRLTSLREGPITRMTIEKGKDLDLEARAFLVFTKDEKECKEARMIKGLRDALSLFQTAMHTFYDPVQEWRTWYSRTVAQREMERRAEADRQRREREIAALAQQKKEREEQAQHYFDQGHEEEAIAHLEAPLSPVSLPDAKEPPGKVKDVTVIETFKLPVDERGKLRADWCSSPALLAGYFVEHPEDLIALMEPKPNEWKRRATSSKGQWHVPGVTFIKSPETRNRG